MLTKRQLLRLCHWFAMLVMFASMASFFHQHLHTILNWLDKLGFWAPCLFLALYCLMSIFCLPNVLLALAGGALFGFAVGTLLNLLGATLGAVCGFCISRYLLPHSFTFTGTGRVTQLMRQVDSHGWKSVALLRLMPALPYNVVNYGLGVTHIKFSHYVIATTIFLIPNKIVMTYCGYAGIRLFT